jgi:hypothetical protein
MKFPCKLWNSPWVVEKESEAAAFVLSEMKVETLQM